MSCTIQGIGLVGGFGCGRTALLAALEQGVTPLQRVAMAISDDAGSNEIAQVPALTADTAMLAGYLSKAAQRRLDHYSRMMLLAALGALEDANALNQRPRRMGIILCTGYGPTCKQPEPGEHLNDADDIFGSPTKFAASVHNAAAGHLAMVLKETGPNLSVSQYDMSVPQALLTAQLWLVEARVDAVLVGSVDLYCHELGLQQYITARSNGQSSGYAVVGEGAAFLLLLPQSTAASGYAQIHCVRMGRSGYDVFHSPSNVAPQTIITGFDGGACLNDDRCDPHGLDLIPASARVASYTALYGALPTGQMFDVAIAALALKNKVIYASARPLPASLEYGSWTDRQIITKQQPLETDGLRCLRMGAGGLYGWVDVC